MRARLIVESGEAAPRELELDDSAVVRLGRNRENHVILDDRHASRSHAKIFARNGHWFIRDQGTTNGTRLDGARIYHEAALRDGQRIDIGDTRLRFRVDSSKEGTDQMPVLATLPEVAALRPLPVADLGHPTLLQVDELTAVVNFMNAAASEAVPHRLVRLALEAVERQTGADLAGFLGLDDDPEFKVVFPAQATVDKQLSRQLTQKALEAGRLVWLGAPVAAGVESESLANFRDAVCVPLRAGAADPAAPPEPPLGTLHAYKSNAVFADREVGFCEVLARHLASLLARLRDLRALEADNSRLRDHAGAAGDQLVGSSPAIAHLRELIQRSADSGLSVLIYGESGVGKELVAEGLHRRSARRNGPLVAVNCAAITASMPESELFGHVKGAFTGAIREHEGYFMQADLGTLFLDEIGELSLKIQAKLLRALEYKRFQPVGARSESKADVRIIAATNRDLGQEVREGRFREDLFFRLSVINLTVPPLREHPEDIPELVEHFLRRLAVETRKRVRLSQAALARLQNYGWRGNVRQLRSVLEAAVAMARPNAVLEASDLNLVPESPEPEALGGPPSLNLKEVERWVIFKALERTGNNNTQAARILGIHRDTLIEKLKRFREEEEDDLE
jgi:Nif-specific regulatory protein